MANNSDYNPQDLLYKKVQHLIQEGGIMVFVGKSDPLHPSVLKTAKDVVRVNSSAVSICDTGVWVRHTQLETT